MSITEPVGVMAAYIIEEFSGGVLIKCPFCHDEHVHSEAGIHWSSCGIGSYTTIQKATGKSSGPTQRFG